MPGGGAGPAHETQSAVPLHFSPMRREREGENLGVCPANRTAKRNGRTCVNVGVIVARCYCIFAVYCLFSQLSQYLRTCSVYAIYV